MTAGNTAAVRGYPELALLVGLRESGWVGLPPFLDRGEIAQVDAFRIWSNGWRDAIRIRDRGDALGIRINTDDPPGLMWEFAGSLAEVAAALLEPPGPGSRLESRLVIGRAPRLWVPRGGLR